MVKRLPAVQTHVPSLGWEDPLEKEMATYSSTLAWKIPWSRKGSDKTERLHFTLYIYNFIHLCILGCAGSSCCKDFLRLQ